MFPENNLKMKNAKQNAPTSKIIGGLLHAIMNQFVEKLRDSTVFMDQFDPKKHIFWTITIPPTCVFKFLQC